MAGHKNRSGLHAMPRSPSWADLQVYRRMQRAEDRGVYRETTALIARFDSCRGQSEGEKEDEEGSCGERES